MTADAGAESEFVAWREPLSPQTRAMLTAAYRQAGWTALLAWLVPTALLAPGLWFELAVNGGRSAWVLVVVWVGVLSTFGAVRLRRFLRLRTDLAQGIVRRVTGRVTVLAEVGRGGGRTYRLCLQDDTFLTIPSGVAWRILADHLPAPVSSPAWAGAREPVAQLRLTIVYGFTSQVVLEVLNHDREPLFSHPH